MTRKIITNVNKDIIRKYEFCIEMENISNKRENNLR